MLHDRSGLAATAAAAGVWTRGSLAAAGLPPGRRRWRLERHLVRVAHDVHVADPDDLSPYQRGLVAALAAPAGAASGPTAAAVLGLWRPRRPPRPQVVVPPPARCRAQAVDVVAAPVLPGELRAVRPVADGADPRLRLLAAPAAPSAWLLVTSPLRTVVDLAASCPGDSGCPGRVVAARAAEVAVSRGLVRRHELPAAVRATCDPRSESLLETWVRTVLERAGLRVHVQVEVVEPSSGRLRRLDLVVEGGDGRVVAVEAGGGVHDENWYADRTRDQDVRVGLGLEVVYVRWRDLVADERVLLRWVLDALVLARPASARLREQVAAAAARA